MRSDDLINRLTAGLEPAPRRTVPAALLAAAGAGLVCATALVVVTLHVRPDLAQAVQSPLLWLKSGYGLAAALAGGLALERLARPAGEGRRGFMLAGAAFMLMVLLGMGQLLAAPEPARLDLWLGGSWRVCALNILMLAGPMIIITLLAVRRLAPTRLTLAGAACGLFSGGVAAMAYCLHCPETAPAFVATWYSLGLMLTTAVGALLGGRMLRWR